MNDEFFENLSEEIKNITGRDLIEQHPILGQTIDSIIAIWKEARPAGMSDLGFSTMLTDIAYVTMYHMAPTEDADSFADHMIDRATANREIIDEVLAEEKAAEMNNFLGRLLPAMRDGVVVPFERHRR